MSENYTIQTTKEEIKRILLTTLKCTLNLFNMANKIQFEHLLRYKKEQRKQKQKQEYLETKYGYKSQNNYPYDW